MKMSIEIYRNDEKINTITSTDPATIYRNIAQAFRSKDTKMATVKTTYAATGIDKITELFKPSETTNNATYKYIYFFEDVTL